MPGRIMTMTGGFGPCGYLRPASGRELDRVGAVSAQWLATSLRRPPLYQVLGRIVSFVAQRQERDD
jgi:hypothetical protein